MADDVELLIAAKTSAAVVAVDYLESPPAYLEVGAAETFRDETVAYAQAIWAQEDHPSRPNGCL